MLSDILRPRRINENVERKCFSLFRSGFSLNPSLGFHAPSRCHDGPLDAMINWLDSKATPRSRRFTICLGPAFIRQSGFRHQFQELIGVLREFHDYGQPTANGTPWPRWRYVLRPHAGFHLTPNLEGQHQRQPNYQSLRRRPSVAHHHSSLTNDLEFGRLSQHSQHNDLTPFAHMLVHRHP